MHDRERKTREEQTEVLSARPCNTSSRWTISVLVCFWVLSVCVPIYAIDRDRKLDELYHTSWARMEGAPSEVRALAQTSDGFLWLGTSTNSMKHLAFMQGSSLSAAKSRLFRSRQLLRAKVNRYLVAPGRWRGRPLDMQA
jgi:hypothetical protein